MPVTGAPVVSESIESRHTYERDNRTFGVRIYHVSNIDSPALALNAAGVPQIGDAFPDASGLIAFDRDAAFIEGQPTAVRIEIEYGESDFIPPDTNPEDLGYVQFQVRPSAQFKEVWRVNPGLVFPINGNADNSVFDDILGVSVDSNGEPVTYLRRSVSFVINETIKQKELNVPLYFSFAGTRNSVSFFNFVPGALLYVGADVTGSFKGGKVRVSHEFLADEWWHLQQAPRRGTDGEPRLKTVGMWPDPPVLGIDSEPIKAAQNVYWRQPFTTLKPFKDISPYF